MSKLITELRVTKLISQGRQGPPGPSGTGVGVKQASLFMENPTNKTVTLLAYALYDMTLDQIFGLKLASGTLDLTIAINGTPVTGLNGLNVDDNVQNPLATANNAVSVGDRITMTISNVSSAVGLEGVLKHTA